MSPPDDLEVKQWNDLVLRWQSLAMEWAQWWQRAAAPMTTAAPVNEGTPPLQPNGAPMFDARKVAELNERFAPRVQALWMRMVNGATPSSAEVDASAGEDRRFSAAAW